MLLITAALMLSAATPALAIQCVPYAREVSGIDLKGDAWEWWRAATGRYDRGRAPKDGAVLVFSRQGAMRHGHVSVVTRVVSPRLVLVDHANWAPARGAGRGEVSTAVPVLDVSPKNDWSEVRVWYHPIGDFGSRVYKAEGYVYQPSNANFGRPMIQKAALQRAADLYPNDRTLARQAHHMESSKDEAAQPKVQDIAAQAMAKASAAPIEATPEAPAAHASTGSDLIRTAKHMFRSRGTAGHNESVNSFLFN